MSNKYITEYPINDEVGRLLNSIAEKHNFEKFHFEVNEAFSKGDGYTGILKSVKIINPNNLSKILCLLIKSSPREKNIREILHMAELFNTESYMYDTIFPCFKDLELQEGLTSSTVMPKFFGSLLNDKQEMIILENLKENGYRLHDRNTPLNGEHIRLVIAAYGKFHSLSLALRNQQPKMFQNLQSKLCNAFPKLIGGFKNLLMNKYDHIINVLDEDCSKKIKNFLQNFECEFEKLLNPPIDEYSVIIHGDCWMNNILFKYSEESSNPIDVRLIDYQASRLAPGVLDLAYFFFTCSSENEIIRCKEYLKLYYQVLSTHLEKLGCDPNKLYPYSVFMKQWNKFAKYSLIMLPLTLLVTLRAENDNVDLKETVKTGGTLSESFDRDTENDEEYNRRVKTIISYLVKNDIL